eukprot:jgi/Astpho2/3629/fgenesh1_pg.00058_%23_26_t
MLDAPALLLSEDRSMCWASSRYLGPYTDALQALYWPQAACLAVVVAQMPRSLDDNASSPMTASPTLTAGAYLAGTSHSRRRQVRSFPPGHAGMALARQQQQRIQQQEGPVGLGHDVPEAMLLSATGLGSNQAGLEVSGVGGAARVGAEHAGGWLDRDWTGVQHQLVQGLKEAWQSMRPQVGSLCQPVLGMCQQGRPSKIDQRPQTEAICSVGGHPGQLLQDDSISDDGTDSMPQTQVGSCLLHNRQGFGGQEVLLRGTADEREAAVAAGASPSSAIELLDSPVARANLPPRQQQQRSRAEYPEQRLRQQRPPQRVPGAAEEMEEQLQRMWGLAGIREERPHLPATQIAAQIADGEEQLQHMQQPAGMMDERQAQERRQRLPFAFGSFPPANLQPGQHPLPPQASEAPLMITPNGMLVSGQPGGQQAGPGGPGSTAWGSHGHRNQPASFMESVWAGLPEWHSTPSALSVNHMWNTSGIDESHPEHSPQWGTPGPAAAGRGAAARRGAGRGAGARTSSSGEGRPEGTPAGRSQEDLDHELAVIVMLCGPDLMSAAYDSGGSGPGCRRDWCRVCLVLVVCLAAEAGPTCRQLRSLNVKGEQAAGANDSTARTREMALEDLRRFRETMQARAQARRERRAAASAAGQEAGGPGSGGPATQDLSGYLRGLPPQGFATLGGTAWPGLCHVVLGGFEAAVPAACRAVYLCSTLDQTVALICELLQVRRGLFGPNSVLAPNLFAPNEGIANLIADMETLGPREGVERLMSIFGRAPSRDMTYEALCQLEDVRLTTSKGTLDALPLDMVTVGSEWLDQVGCLLANLERLWAASRLTGLVAAARKQLYFQSLEQKCSICQCELELEETVVRLPCKHGYHRNCIFEWLGKHSRKCPICKLEIL